jgi:hypothetical protein
MRSRDSGALVRGRLSGRYAIVAVGALCGLIAIYGSKQWFTYLDRVIKSELCRSTVGGLSVGGLYAIGQIAAILFALAVLGIYFVVHGRAVIGNRRNISQDKKPLFDTQLIEGNKAVSMDRQNIMVGVLILIVVSVLLMWPFRIIANYFVVSPSKIERCVHLGVLPEEKK